MEDDRSQEKPESAVVRSEFDKILMHHVSSLIDTREDIAALPFNLATISSLLLLADRENEIKLFPETPPERYHQDTFLADIEEIGLDLDDDAMSAIRDLERYGFMVINPEGQYTARESASLLIMVLDAIFPQMPGMNLVAYVSQAIEEVLTGRKEQDQALSSFDQTLEMQGVRLSTLSEDKLASSAAKRIFAYEPPDPEVLLARRAAYLQKLKALRAKSLSSDTAPSVLAGGSQLKHVKIKELFPREGTAPELEGESDDMLPGEAIDTPESPPFFDESTPDAGLHEREMEGSLPETDILHSASEGLQEPPDASTDASTEIEVDGMQPETTALEAALTDEIETAEAVLPEMGEDEIDLSKEELIEKQIRQFEEELAMPCPICGIGKVLSDTTEKGKTYYHCSNEDCRLISWGKPYHMECPICKNPFLIEVSEPDGQTGLKCPRATCLYRKKGGVEALSEGNGSPGKRKVAVVKKKRKKGVRRVVRRKK